MHRIVRLFPKAYKAPLSPSGPSGLGSGIPLLYGCFRYGTRSVFTEALNIVPHLQAPALNSAEQSNHVREISQQLEQSGILKISLGFPDNDSKYLERLLLSLHQHHGHQLPITHSATRGWFWDIRPTTTNFQTTNCQARSETMNQFPWHTDCSYEDPPPRYFALQVLQHDRYGGGTLSILSVERLIGLLSPASRTALMCPEYRITTPPEFTKDSTPRSIIGSLIVTGENGQASLLRFREDILTPLSERATHALNELKNVLGRPEVLSHLTMNLSSKDLPERSIILVDNRRWLHARTNVKDPERHLRRVRWDAVPFQSIVS
ncbi:Clavaminate synthase-like protein [Hypoxylon sp. NC0597]|nr:Clavaminate synthase-like protein [Hypoxylon sp. NC0597]